MSLLGLLDEEETTGQKETRHQRRGRVVGFGISAGALVSLLVTYAPTILSTVSEWSQLKTEVKHLQEWKAEHSKEHDRLRDRLSRLSRRARYLHGDDPDEPSEEESGGSTR